MTVGLKKAPHRRILIALLFAVAAPLTISKGAFSKDQLLIVSQTVNAEAVRDSQVERVILSALGAPGAQHPSARYSYNRVNLDGTNQQILVFVSGADNCGSGGCTALVLGTSQGHMKVVSNISLARVPIYISSHKTLGWNDLILQVSGGGVAQHYAVLQFDGKKYPENPSVAPAKELTRRIRAIGYLGSKHSGASEFVLPAR